MQETQGNLLIAVDIGDDARPGPRLGPFPGWAKAGTRRRRRQRQSGGGIPTQSPRPRIRRSGADAKGDDATISRCRCPGKSPVIPREQTVQLWNLSATPGCLVRYSTEGRPSPDEARGTVADSRIRNPTDPEFPITDRRCDAGGGCLAVRRGRGIGGRARPRHRAMQDLRRSSSNGVGPDAAAWVRRPTPTVMDAAVKP